MTLRDSMDRYHDAARAALGAGAQEPRSWFGSAQNWRPDVVGLEAVVGFEIGEEARMLWSHPLSIEEQFLPESVFVPGPIALILGSPLLRFGQVHIDVSRQLPLIHMAPDLSQQIVVADGMDQSVVWVAGAGLHHGVSHPLQISLAEMFELWTESLALGEMVARDGRIVVVARDLAFDARSLEGVERRAYACLPGGADGRREVALAQGVAVGDVGDPEIDFLEWLRLVDQLSRDRLSAWEQRNAALPFEDLKELLNSSNR